MLGFWLQMGQCHFIILQLVELILDMMCVGCLAKKCLTLASLIVRIQKRRWLTTANSATGSGTDRLQLMIDYYYYYAHATKLGVA